MLMFAGLLSSTLTLRFFKYLSSILYGCLAPFVNNSVIINIGPNMTSGSCGKGGGFSVEGPLVGKAFCCIEVYVGTDKGLSEGFTVESSGVDNLALGGEIKSSELGFGPSNRVSETMGDCDGGKEDMVCDGISSGNGDSLNLVNSTGVDESGGFCMGCICSTRALEISVGWVAFRLFGDEVLSDCGSMVEGTLDVIQGNSREAPLEIMKRLRIVLAALSNDVEIQWMEEGSESPCLLSVLCIDEVRRPWSVNQGYEQADVDNHRPKLCK